MLKFKPVKQSRVSDAVFDQIKNSILLRILQPGDRLPAERSLAEEFKVSRVAVREAIRALESSGLVMTRLGSTGGAYVTDFGFDNFSKCFFDLFLADKISLFEIHKVRMLIDAEVGRLAALNVTPEYRKRLLHVREREYSPEEYRSPDSMSTRVEVYYILAEMCGNRFLEAMVKIIIAVSGQIINAFKTERKPFHPPGSHLKIIEPVLAGNAEAAARAMREHALEVSEILQKLEKAYRRKIKRSMTEG